MKLSGTPTRQRESPSAFDAPPQGATPGRLAERQAALAAMGAVMLAALAVVAPFLRYGTASGHDIAFHLASWMDVARQWQQGILYPRWAAWANFGYGEPRFIFYPPMSWLLGAALGSILPWKVVPGTFIWLSLTLAGATMFRLARQWMRPREAICAAVLYTVNPYQLLLVYFRSDYAELLASTLFPLVVLYASRLAAAPATRSASATAQVLRSALARNVAMLALVFAAVWLTNAPAGVVVTYSLTLLLVILALLRRRAATFLGGAAAMVLGWLLAGYYIVPAAYEQGWVRIAEALSSGLRPEQNFLFTAINDPEHNQFNLTVSTIAAAQIAITGVAAVVSSLARRAARELWWALLVLGAAAAALMFPATQLAWRYLPELRFVQFPWRWLFALGLAFAFFVAAALRETRARLAWTLLMAAMLAGVGAYLVHLTWWDTQDVPVLQAAIGRDLRSASGYEGTDEYQSLGADHYDLPRGAPLVALVPAAEEGRGEGARPSRVHIERWEAQKKLFTVDARQPVVATLRLMNYPAWQVEVNGVATEAESHQDTGQMMIALPAGYSHVRVRFARTTDRTIGALLSGAAALALLGLARAGRRRSADIPERQD